MSVTRPYCLSIAGFDPSAGAGILADIKTFEQLNVYGLGVNSAITYQNENKFNGVEWISFEGIEKQLMPLKGYPVQKVKIGLIENLSILDKVIELLYTLFPSIFIIWDPILKSSSGFTFHDNKTIPESILNKIGLITPNLEEYNQLKLHDIDRVNCAVLLKGGHLTEKKGCDYIFIGDRQIEIKGLPFENITEKHGTGCILSAATCAYLAHGETLTESCKKGKKYVEKVILSNKLKLGYHSE